MSTKIEPPSAKTSCTQAPALADDFCGIAPEKEGNMNSRKMPRIECGTTTINIEQAIAYGQDRGWPVTRRKIHKALADGHLEAVKDTTGHARRTKKPMVYLWLENFKFWALNIMLVPYNEPMPKGGNISKSKKGGSHA